MIKILIERKRVVLGIITLAAVASVMWIILTEFTSVLSPENQFNSKHRSSTSAIKKTDNSTELAISQNLRGESNDRGILLKEVDKKTKGFSTKRKDSETKIILPKDNLYSSFSGTAVWRRYAVRKEYKGKNPLIAIVIDDAGTNYSRLKLLLSLGIKPLTIAFLPYSKDVQKQVSMARLAGHEVLVHLPMEPFDTNQDPGPNALTTSMTDKEMFERLNWHLSRFTGYVGVNNHMGSRFTSDRTATKKFLEYLKTRDLIFLDSRTSHSTVAAPLSRVMGIPTLERDIFLDNTFSKKEVLNQLSKAEAIALKKGYVVAIGHLQDWTIQALAEWTPKISSRGFILAPVTGVLELDKKSQEIKLTPSSR